MTPGDRDNKKGAWDEPKRVSGNCGQGHHNRRAPINQKHVTESFLFNARSPRSLS